MGGPGGQQKPFKSILPPIHQAQLDRYDSINTEEVVRQVKKDPEKNRNYKNSRIFDVLQCFFFVPFRLRTCFLATQ